MSGDQAGVIEAPMSDEQAADFARLQAAAGDGVPMGGAPLEGGAADVDPLEKLTGELADAAGMVIAMASNALPSLKPIYTPDVIRAGAAQWAALCHKHGWLRGGVWGGEWKEEIACAVFTVPLAIATYQAVKADLAKIKQDKTATAAVNVTPDSPDAASFHSNTVTTE